MPFTPTHILAVVPIALLFGRLPFSALAIGAVVPDLPLFFPIGSYALSHSLYGALYYCLPMGLVIYFYISFLGEKFFIACLPAWVSVRLGAQRTSGAMDIKSRVLLALAVYIGALTHQVWDAFTHLDGWGVLTFPVLTHSLDLGSFVIPIYKLLQYGSTFLGLPILLLIGLVYLRKEEPCYILQSGALTRNVKVAIAVSFIVVAVVTAIIVYNTQDTGVKDLMGSVIKQSIAYGCILFVSYSVVFKLTSYRRG